MQDISLDRVDRELQEIESILEMPDLEAERQRLRDWLGGDGGRVLETATTFARERNGANALAAATAAHAFAARLDSIAAGAAAQGGGSGVGGVLSGAWNALKAKVISVLQQVWSLISSLGTVSEWTLTGEVGTTSILGLAKASIAITFT